MTTRIVTVIMKRDGSLHLASDSMSTGDTERWADEGYTVFRLAAVKDRWVANHVNSGKILTSDSPAPAGSIDPDDFTHLLELK